MRLGRFWWHTLRGSYPRAAREIWKVLWGNIFVETKKKKRNICGHCARARLYFEWLNAERQKLIIYFQSNINTRRDGQHIIIVSRAACGWNVCAVSCKFARKHIPRRTWVHNGDVMRRGEVGRRNQSNKRIIVRSMRAFTGIAFRKQRYRMDQRGLFLSRYDFRFIFWQINQLILNCYISNFVVCIFNYTTCVFYV